jgi:hypothetical protein
MGISNVLLWKANHYGIDPELQLGSFETNVLTNDGSTTSVGFTGGARTLPVNQHMVTASAHITF